MNKTMKYHHIGIPTDEPKENESYIRELDIHCTDHESNPYGIQWMRYGKKCKLPKIVKNSTHIAFEVEDIEKEIRGKKVIIEPNSPSKGVIVAFVLDNGLPVEFIQYIDKDSNT